jgi:hypothetical protein
MGYAAAIATALIAAWSLGTALADAPPGVDPNGPLATWFKSVMHPRLGPCCNIGDGHFVRAWKDSSGWHAEVDHAVVDIPDSAVPEGEASPNGQPVLWLNKYDGSPRCFIPAGTGT